MLKLSKLLFLSLFSVTALAACDVDTADLPDDESVDDTGAAGVGDGTETDGEADSDVDEGNDDSYTFGYTSMTQNNPFFITIEETMREDIEANGDRLITTDPAMDVSLQISQIEDMITQGIDAIFLNPVDWEGIRPALEMLDAADIPIINYDTEVADMEYVTSYVGSDNYNAGYVAGEDLVEKLPDGGTVIILESPQMNSIRDRVEGFEAAIEGSNIEVIARQDAQGDLSTALSVTEDLLIANPDVDAIFGGNDPTALGALAAAQAQGFSADDGPMIYGVDGSPDLKQELAGGDTLIEGTGAQSPINIARESVVVAYQILNGEDFSEDVPVETFLISDENISDYDPEGWQ